MKRRTLKFIACAAAMALTLSVTACGGSDDSAKNNTSTVENTADTKPEVEDKAEDKTEVDAEKQAAYDELTEGLTDEQADAAVDAVDAMVDADTSEFETLEDWFTEPTIASAYGALMDSMGEEGIEISYEVTGNEFIMIFQITDSAYIADDMGDMLNAAMEEQADLFKQQVVAPLDELIGETGACTVTMRYTDPDGDLIAETSFHAD